MWWNAAAQSTASPSKNNHHPARVSGSVRGLEHVKWPTKSNICTVMSKKIINDGLLISMIYIMDLYLAVYLAIERGRERDEERRGKNVSCCLCLSEVTFGIYHLS
jgi:hypothetical protein